MRALAPHDQTLTTFIFLAVLSAAFLHASWNLVVKIADDRFLAMFTLQSMMGLMGVLMLAVFPFPLQASWSFAIISGVLHTGYNLFLARSYRHGDLGLVYPVARGTAPLLTLLGTKLFTQDSISHFAFVGIVVLILGIWLIALSGKVLKTDKATLGFALITSVFIGCYTIVDGLGARASGNASGYTGLVFLLDACSMLAAGLILRGPTIIRSVTPIWKRGLAGAVMSGTAYWIVIWAMAHAPIAMVAALRETSILFVLIFSARFLRETVSWQRAVGALFVVAGAIALRV